MSNTDFEEPDGDAHEESEEVVDEVDGQEEAEAEGSDEVETAEAAADAGDDGDVDEPPRRGRANETIRSLRARAQEEAERAERLSRELREEREAMQRAQQRSRGETEQQLAERLALMTPEERSDYKVGMAVEQMRRENAMLAFQAEERADKQGFDSKAEIDPLYAKWASKVEEKRLEFMRQGTAIPRMELFKWLVGESVIAARGKGTGKQRRQGAETVRRQSAPVVNGRADARGDRRAAGDTPAKRLEGVII